MIHIVTEYDDKAKAKIAARRERSTSVVLDANVLPPEAVLCGAQLGVDDSLTDTALASDCDACRTAAGVALTRDKTWAGTAIGVRPVPEWDAQPMENADEIMAAKKDA